MSAIIVEPTPVQVEQPSLPKAEPCVVVIFGATGDLTKRKLMPALCRLVGMGCLESVRILGVGRSTMSEQEFQKVVHEALQSSKKIEHLDEEQWRKFSERLHYMAGELDDLGAIYRRISMMTVKEKVELAQKGNKEERRILIGDANKIVSMAVLNCESLSQAEIEAFCSMRHLATEIFHEIATTREWIKKPRIQLALVTNPAVPLSITLPLVKFLGMRDLRNIGRDRNLPEGIRLAARKILLEKRG